ncbi:MAG: ribbon-helix-helix domain-containing protein, partial [Bifidobacteriaceae bacterium]|nr:ribbon-helix-helix domain-containing protein [Bifidobacteriaceae bacterium]
MSKGDAMGKAVSLYLDDEVIAASESAARQRGMSLSRYVNGQLRAASGAQWPDGFFDLFGAIEDDAFTRPGGMQPGINLGGPSKRSDVTVQMQYSAAVHSHIVNIE